jgi:hypothetical protein
MKIYKNVLSGDLLDRIHKDVIAKFDGPNWSVSDLFWHNGIKEGFSGNCLISTVEGDLEREIKKEIVSLLPIHKYLKLQHYVWTRNSGISVHSDDRYKFSGTIYLNEDWNPNHGGIFLWKNKNSTEDILSGYTPSYNSMVVNDENESHMVTPISVYAKEFRATIQIWGL